MQIETLISRLQDLQKSHSGATVYGMEYAYGTTRMYPISDAISGEGITTCTSMPSSGPKVILDINHQ
jgi:hypothetical protein